MIRKPAVADMFYPGEPHALSAMIKSFLAQAKETKLEGRLRALIVPHAGYIYSGSVAAYGYKLLKDSPCKRFILIGPSHYVAFEGAAFDHSDAWETPLGTVRLIEGRETAVMGKLAAAHRREHCLEVQVPFLQAVVKDFKILPMVTGEVDPLELAEEVLQLWDERTIIIVSSDLSHYYPYDVAVTLDAKANTAIPKLDIAMMEDAEACGKTGILTLLHIAKKQGWKGTLLQYRNSGDTAGDKSKVVGYGCYAFTE